MSERLKSLQRIVAVQAQRKTLAEWALAAVDARKAAIAAARTELDAFVGDANLTGPLATLALAQARRLSEREAAAEVERTLQRGVLQGAERRHRLAERIAESAAAEHRTVEDRRALERLIESAVARAQQEDGG